MENSSQKNVWNMTLLMARIIAGGALVFAAFLKLSGAFKAGAPLAFTEAIMSFELVQWPLAVLMAYYLPWVELIAGVCLVLGIWTRQAAFICLCVYLSFTFALGSVLIRDMNISCGCFGGIFGDSTISAKTIFRNLVFIVCSFLPLALGGGHFVLLKEIEADKKSHE